MITTHKLSDAQAAVLSGPVEWNADGSTAVTTGRENTLASLRRAGFLAGNLLTRNGMNARTAIQADPRSRKTLATEEGMAVSYTPAASEAPANAPVSKLDKITELTGITLPDAPECAAHKRTGWDESGHACVVLPNGVHTYMGMLRYSDGKGRHGVAVTFPYAWESRRDETGVITYYANGGAMTMDMIARAYAGETVDGTPAAPAAPDVFDMANLTDVQVTVLETNIGRVPEVIKAAADVASTALVAFDGASSARAWSHQITYYREATATLGADVDPAAYSSAVCNANDTAREEGFPYMSAEWFACFDSSYECMRVENETARQRAEFYAAQEAEDNAAYADMLAATHVLRFEGDMRALCGERIDRRESNEGILRVDVDPTRANCPECVRQAETLAAQDAQDGPTDDETHAAILDALTAAESHVEAYPHKTADGRTVWACCESNIGAPCEHRTGSRSGGPVVVVEPSRDNPRKAVAWILGASQSLRREFRADRSTWLHVAYWAQSNGVRPVKGNRFQWQQHETLSLAPARI